MNFEEFIHEINYDRNNIRYYRLFETLVLKILDKYLEDQSKIIVSPKIFKIQRGINIEYDGYIPAGIDDLPEGTAVDIKFFKRDVEHNKKTLHFYTEVPEINSILYIFGSKLTPDEKNRIYKTNDIPLKIWDLNDLIKISEKYHQYVSEIIPKLSETELNETVSKSLKIGQNDWKTSRDEYINKLKDVYKKDDLVLFLGAGISKEADVPEWKTLVSDLFARMIDEKLIENNISMNEYEKHEIEKELKSINEASPLLQARYIRTGLGSSFIKILSELLYKNFNDGADNYGTSNQLKSIAKLCSPTRIKLGIRALVTYNFDDLIEKNLEMIGVDFKSIYREIDIASQDELSIYHVHGFLSRDFNENEISSDNLLVFSEERYHSLYLDPYSWSNITQLNFLRENTCLMLGLSITDPNLRRLLDIAARKNEVEKHFVILKKQSFYKNIEFNDNIREDVIQKFAVVDEKLKEKSFQELGLNIIWVEDYDEIPGILDSIRS